MVEIELVCVLVNVGFICSGINMDVVKDMGMVIKRVSELDLMVNVKLVVFCNVVEDNFFMVGGFYGVSELDVVINVGVFGFGVVKVVLEKVKG